MIKEKKHRFIDYEEKPENRQDLKKYYKFVFNCIKCNKEFGSDKKNPIHFCYFCYRNWKRRENKK